MSPKTIREDQIPEGVLEVCQQLLDRGYYAWIVGGCVRDLLLGREIHDWDLCTTAKPKEVQKVFRKVIPTGIEHGTVTVLWKGDAFEVTTLRGEGSYTDGRRPDSVFFVDDIREDLLRRDFTVNAIAFDPVRRELVDPFDGLADLDARTLRAVGVALERFTEDGLRILRGARFVASLGFTLEEETRAAFAPTLEIFAKVSPERVSEEWRKALRCEAPSPAFRVMRETGILGVVFPELAEVHPDTFAKGLNCLDDSFGQDYEIRLAALFSCLPLRSDVLRDRVETWLRDFRHSNRERNRCLYALEHSQPLRFEPSKNATVHELRRLLVKIGQEDLNPTLSVMRSISGAYQDGAHEEYLNKLQATAEQPMPWGVGDLEIKGGDVAKAGIRGKEIGETLRRLLEECLEDPSRNQTPWLLDRVEELAKSQQ